jgi:hypothetical protein
MYIRDIIFQSFTILISVIVQINFLFIHQRSSKYIVFILATIYKKTPKKRSQFLFNLPL